MYEGANLIIDYLLIKQEKRKKINNSKIQD